MTSKLRWVWDETMMGLAFNGALAAVASFGHIHREPSWQPACLATLAILLGVFAVTVVHLSAPGRLATAFASFRKPAAIGATVLLALGVLALGLLNATPMAPGAPFNLQGQGQSQLNLWLHAAVIVLFWPAVWSSQLRAERADRRGLMINLFILIVVIQAVLHAARMYEFHDHTVVGAALASSTLAFVLVSMVASFFAWFLTRDAVSASLGSTGTSAPPEVVTDSEAIGIAASGGGIRATAVATGALAVIQKSPLWRRVRFISAVSGGSWALANLVRARDSGDDEQAPERAIANLKRNKDYIRRGTTAEWLVRPLSVAIVGTALQLLSLLFALGLLVVFGLYLDELEGSEQAVWFGQLLTPLKDLALAIDDQLYLRDDLVHLATPFGVGALAGAVGFTMIGVGCALMLLATLRWSSLVEAAVQRLATDLIWHGALIVIAVTIPVLALTSTSLLVGVGVVAAVGWAYIKEWRLQGLGVASLLAGVAGAIGVAMDQSKFLHRVHLGLDGAIRSGLAIAVETTGLLSTALQTFVANHFTPWPENEKVGLSLLVLMGLLGFFYFLISLLIRLEAVGLGPVWRSWVASFAEAERHPLAWPNKGPTPIINMAVNAPSEPFKVAHFEASPSLVGGPTVGYVAQADSSLSMLDAIAVSSAALNSQAGKYVSPWLRPLLSLFSLKLGRWLPHPGLGARPLPALALQYMNREFMGWNSLGDAHLFLSDGGHFENLGGYALLLRGVPTLVLIDAAADPKYQFEDLSRFIDLARYRGYSLHGLELQRHVPPNDVDASGLLVATSVVSEGELR
ncbi:MAG: hypothetical protein JNM69_11945, partial [Archangium sp.]|nr:hypothetical protein [Archangium sp.]